MERDDWGWTTRPEDWRTVSAAEGLRCLRFIAKHELVVPPVEVLVSTRAYTQRIEPAWVRVDRVLLGDATVYPVRGLIPDAGNGQWSFAEVLAVRIDLRGYMGASFPFPESAAPWSPPQHA